MRKRLSRAFDQISDTFNRMTCAHVAKLMPLHVAGELTNKRAAAVARHLRACAVCRAQADEYAASRVWLQAGAQATFEDEFYDEIRATVLSRIRQQRRPAPPIALPFFAPLRKRQLLYIAASIALLALGGALAWHVVSNRSGSKQTTLADNNTAVETATPPKVIEPPTPVIAPAHEPTPQRAPMFRRHTEQSQTVAKYNQPSLQPRAVNHLEFQPEHTLAPAPQQRTTQAEAANDATSQAGAASSSAEVARIELQTADPNIRIIWLAQAPAADDAQPKPEKR